jgi:hypothetical protein
MNRNVIERGVLSTGAMTSSRMREPVNRGAPWRAVEYGWFCQTFGRATEPLPFDDDDVNADLRVEPDETTEGILAFYGRARAAADQVTDELELDATGTAWFGDAVSLRWVLIHMVEETARHAGHVDIVRELIDGMTGDHRPA